MTPEHRKQIQRIKKRINDPILFERDEYEQSVHAKLYCVELSGVLENLLRDSTVAYCKMCANERVLNFVSKMSNRFPNPNVENILVIFSYFDEGWRDKIEQYWAGEMKDSISSIVGNRHLIAHGRNCNVSVVRLRIWVGNVEKFSNYVWNELFCIKDN
ncbi:HEPN domain-containing protein [Hoeflea alexandrii]